MQSIVRRFRVDFERADPFWPAQLAALVSILLYLTIPARLTIGPEWFVPALESVLFLALVLATPGEETRGTRMRQRLAVSLIVVLVVATLVGLGLLVHVVAEGDREAGRGLLRASVVLFATIVLVFALVYWEVDRGGPVARARPEPTRPPDFLFTTRERHEPEREWQPTFVDYLYLALTNSTAFSPTDTMPLTHRAKMAMGVQAVASMVTVVVIVARAVGSLS